MKKYGAVLLNALLIVFGVLGLYFTLYSEGFMNTGTFLYYTVQSNLLAMGSAAVVLVFVLRSLKGAEIPASIQFLRLLSTIAITLTFLVFSLMLTPQLIAEGNSAYLTSPGNLFVHNLVPICAILDWCLFGSVQKLKRTSAFCGIAPALAYICFVFVCVKRGITFSGNRVPYFFLDNETYGWFSIGNGSIGVFWWIVILAAVLVGLGFGFMAIVRRREQGTAKPQSETAESSDGNTCL